MNTIVNCKFQDGLEHLPLIDLVFFDPPTGQTNERWDNIIPILDLERLWGHVKIDSTIIVWGNDSSLIELKYIWSSEFKYSWYWKKTRIGSWIHSASRPMSEIDELAVFSRSTFGSNAVNKIKFNREPTKNLIEFKSTRVVGKIHPCQKPLDLCKFIVETYTKPGDNVLDICCGSGSIPQAAKVLGRNYIAFENDCAFFVDAKHRLDNKNI